MTTIVGEVAESPNSLNSDVSGILGKPVEVEGGIHHRAALVLLNRAVALCPELADEPLSSTITAYLVAHYYSVTHPVETSKSVNGASKSYSRPGPKDKLESTPFGREVLALDPCDVFEKMGYRRGTIRYVI